MTVHHDDGHVQIHHGDCLDVLRHLPDNSVDSVVCDPPYNLSNSAKRDIECVRNVVANVLLPHHQQRHPERSQRGDLVGPTAGGASLSRVNGPVGIGAGIGVPERAVDLKDATIVQKEVNAGDEAAICPPDRHLTGIDDLAPVNLSGDYILQLADGLDKPVCYSTCSCFTEPSAGVIAVSVVVPRSAGGNDTGDSLAVDGSDAHIRDLNNTASQTQRAPSVHADGRAVQRAVLRLDLARGTGELDSTNRTLDHLPLFELVSTEQIRASTGACDLSPVTKPYLVGYVDGRADGAFTLHHVPHVLHSATGGFMGKTWDGWTSPAAFQRWCSAWAAECLRVLKPGGYLLAFGGTRTWHRLAVGIEDAGFELRESVAYLFGSGFPKSLDVGKAIDKANGRQFEDRYALGREIRAAREAAGLNTSDVNAWFGYRDGCQHWERQDASGARVPTLADFGVLRERLGVSDTHRALVEREEAEREKVGVGTSGKTAGMQLLGLSGIAGGDYDITAPATDAARQWHGWGTALKPAHEPIVVARKPLDGTVAQSVLKWGTGALNVDACRINPGSAVAGGGGWAAHKVETTEGWDRPYVNGVAKTEPHAAGRWPANVVLDENQAAALDQQSGTTVSKAAARGDLADHRGGQYAAASGRRIAGSDSVRGHDDSGGASRFFLTAAADPLPIEGLQERFLYTAKAPKSERPSYVKPMLRLRSDLTEEQRAHVTARLAEAGVQLD